MTLGPGGTEESLQYWDPATRTIRYFPPYIADPDDTPPGHLGDDSMLVVQLAQTARNAVSVHPDPAMRTQFVELTAKALVLPRGEQWNDAVSTALMGDWQLSESPQTSVLGALKSEAQQLHRQLTPIWRRRTRHGRVLSLDADLGDGMSLHDLVASTGTDGLQWATEGVFEDSRLFALMRALSPMERTIVVALATGDGVTWSEAAAATGAADVFGERVRRKVKRLVGEQQRRNSMRTAGQSS